MRKIIKIINNYNNFYKKNYNIVDNIDNNK